MRMLCSLTRFGTLQLPSTFPAVALPNPRRVPRIGAPRWLALALVSKKTAAPPSPGMKPSRLRSRGRKEAAPWRQPESKPRPSSSTRGTSPIQLPQPFFEDRPAIFYAAYAPASPLYLPIYTGASPGMTWHLSVINAGRPRQDEEKGNLIAGPEESYFSPVSWNGSELSGAQWILADTEGIDIVAYRMGSEVEVLSIIIVRSRPTALARTGP